MPAPNSSRYGTASDRTRPTGIGEAEAGAMATVKRIQENRDDLLRWDALDDPLPGKRPGGVDIKFVPGDGNRKETF